MKERTAKSETKHKNKAETFKKTQKHNPKSSNQGGSTDTQTRTNKNKAKSKNTKLHNKQK